MIRDTFDKMGGSSQDEMFLVKQDALGEMKFSN